MDSCMRHFHEHVRSLTLKWNYGNHTSKGIVMVNGIQETSWRPVLILLMLHLQQILWNLFQIRSKKVQYMFTKQYLTSTKCIISFSNKSISVSDSSWLSTVICPHIENIQSFPYALVYSKRNEPFCFTMPLSSPMAKGSFSPMSSVDVRIDTIGNNSTIGLVNFGNTCYMNSILQALKNVPDLWCTASGHSKCVYFSSCYWWQIMMFVQWRRDIFFRRWLEVSFVMVGSIIFQNSQSRSFLWLEVSSLSALFGFLSSIPKECVFMKK